jgi:hypothetical protein
LAVVCASCSDSAPIAAPNVAGASGSSSAGAGTAGAATGSGSSGAGSGAGGTLPSSAGAAPAAGMAGSVASAGAADSGAGGSGGGPPPSVAPSASKDAESKLTSAGLSLVSYGGYLNGESFQQDAIVTHRSYQYTAFWNTARHVVLARRALPAGAWQSFEFSDYTNSEADAHNTISLGLSELDGTLHLAFDHHVSPLHYRKSVAGLLTDPAAVWSAASFGAVTSNLGAGDAVKDLTYPRFVSEPSGSKLLLSARLGSSGSGDEYLWEYDAGTRAWTSLGKYIDGLVDNINAYLHGLAYDRARSRLHAAWCWRETPDAASNHDLLYAYSDDHGRTWQNDAGASIGTTGGTAINASSAGLAALPIEQNRGLINQEHMTVDAAGRVHVLLSHLPDSAADDSNFDSARAKSQYFHYLRESPSTWSRHALNLPAVANFRGKLAVSSSGNVYAVLPDLRVAAASPSSFATWRSLVPGEPGRFFSDPLIDASRLLTEDKLSVVYPTKASGDIFVIDYSLE